MASAMRSQKSCQGQGSQANNGLMAFARYSDIPIAIVDNIQFEATSSLIQIFVSSIFAQSLESLKNR